MNLKPLGDRVILKQDEAEVTTASGLFLASDAKEKPQTGTIIAVGEGKMDKDGKLLPMPVKVGDKVIYGKFGGTEVTLDGENVLILRADDVAAGPICRIFLPERISVGTHACWVEGDRVEGENRDPAALPAWERARTAQPPASGSQDAAAFAATLA